MLIAFLMFLFPVKAIAFINVEEVRREAGPGFVGKSSATINGQKGNTDKFAVGLSTLNIYREAENEFLFLGDYNFSETFGPTDTNNGRGHVRYTLNPERRFSVEFFIQSEFDQFKQIRSRDLAGVNLRQRLGKNETESFYAGYGTFYEYQIWNDNEVFQIPRANFYLTYVNQFNKCCSAFGILYLQPSWLALKDFRFELQAGTTAILTERLSLTAQISAETETKRPVGVKPTDVTYTSGLMLKY